MNPFRYGRATTNGAAIAAVTPDPHAAYLAGGTSLVDLMKLDVERPATVVDITHLRFGGIESLPDGGLRIGALAKMSDVADHPSVVASFPVVAQALAFSASAQLRNMASLGGNLLQRTRCSYFRDTATACNKREVGSGCTALEGLNRNHAILGGSDRCICTHPSDLAVALRSSDAVLVTESSRGERRIPLGDFYLLPTHDPALETALPHGALITAIELPAHAVNPRSKYVKVRDRASYAFALVSAAAALDVEGGTIRGARLALGGVAPIPWRAAYAEASLVGKPAIRATYETAADLALADAVARTHNGYKIPLAKRTIVRALSEAGRTG